MVKTLAAGGKGVPPNELFCVFSDGFDSEQFVLHSLGSISANDGPVEFEVAADTISLLAGISGLDNAFVGMNSATGPDGTTVTVPIGTHVFDTNTHNWYAGMADLATSPNSGAAR